MHRFTLLHNSDSNAAIAFVEGLEDKQYLQLELRRRNGGCDAHFIICDGKSGVFDALAEVEKRYTDAKRVMFFVDKDFDDFVPVTYPSSWRLFTTTVYSVENYLVSDEALKSVLCHMAHMEHDDSRLPMILDQYNRVIRDLALRMRRFIACAICAKRAGVRVTLANVELNRVFAIDERFELRISDGFAEALRTMSGIPVGVVGTDDVRRQIRSLRVEEWKRWLRGKFERWAFVKYLEVLRRELGGTPVSGTRNFPKAVLVTDGSCFQALAGRVPYPPELTQFLDTIFA